MLAHRFNYLQANRSTIRPIREIRDCRSVRKLLTYPIDLLQVKIYKRLIVGVRALLSGRMVAFILLLLAFIDHGLFWELESR